MSRNWTVETQFCPKAAQRPAYRDLEDDGSARSAHPGSGAARLEPFVSRNVDHENGCASEGHFDRIRHVELARLHDRRHRIDELLTRMAGLADDREDVL